MSAFSNKQGSKALIILNWILYKQNHGSSSQTSTKSNALKRPEKCLAEFDFYCNCSFYSEVTIVIYEPYLLCQGPYNYFV